MLITRQSLLSGKTTTQDIPVTQEQLDEWEAGARIQDAMPHLTLSQREFIMTGISDEDWDTLAPEDDAEITVGDISNPKPGSVVQVFHGDSHGS